MFATHETPGAQQPIRTVDVAETSLADRALAGLLERIQGANFVITPDLKVVQLNSRAQRLAQQQHLLTIDAERRLRFASLKVHASLARIAATVGTGASDSRTAILPDQVGPGATDLTIMPLAGTSTEPRDYLLISLRQAGSPNGAAVGLASRRFGLTTAEQSVVARFCAGESLREIANRTGLEYVTVRNQLTSAKQKVGVRRQVELLRAFDRFELRLMICDIASPPAAGRGTRDQDAASSYSTSVKTLAPAVAWAGSIASAS